MQTLTIITINYNNCEGLRKTMQSVKSQNFKGYEYIVVDGGSTDGSINVIKENLDIVAFWLSERDNGIYHAMNKGIRKANGEYLLFLNSGDTLATDSILKEMLQLLKSDIVYGNLITTNKDRKKQTHISFSEANVENLMISTIWHPCAFIRKKLFLEFGFYNEGFKLAADYEFFIRAIIKHDASAHYCDKAIAEFDTGGVSNNPENAKLMEVERELSWKLNFSDAIIEMFEKKVQLIRSSEYRLGKKITKFFPG